MASTTLNKLVFELLELRRAYIKSTDPIDKRIVIDWIQTQRARLLKQKFSQPFALVDDHYVQSLTDGPSGAIEMEKVQSNNILPNINNEVYMYRTSVDIPRTIETKDGCGLFTRIGPADGLSEGFEVTTYKHAFFKGNGKFNHNTIYAFVLGDRVYLTSKSGMHLAIKYLDIRGVFQDPIEAALINDPDWTYDDDYPINKELIDQMKVLIINEKFGLTLIQAGDKTDNLEDNPEGQTKKVQNIQTQQE
jgi:hypothetical protein